MEIQLLGQGYEKESENSVGNHLIKLLSDKEFQSFTAISAFISQAGVTGLSTHIEKAKENQNIFIFGQNKSKICFLNHLVK